MKTSFRTIERTPDLKVFRYTLNPYCKWIRVSYSNKLHFTGVNVMSWFYVIGVLRWGVPRPKIKEVRNLLRKILNLTFGSTSAFLKWIKFLIRVTYTRSRLSLRFSLKRRRNEFPEIYIVVSVLCSDCYCNTKFIQFVE